MTTGKKWPQANPVVRYNFFLNWNGMTLFFDKKSRVITRSEVTDSKSFCYSFCDFPQEEGPEQTYIQAEAKYAHILARRQAQQAGELTADSVFHTYQTVKTGRNESELVYHIIPRTLLENTKAACQIPAGCVLMDWTGLLLGLLKKGGKKDQAIALRAESSIIIIAGNAVRVKLIRRYQLFSESQDIMENVQNMIEHDLDICRREKSADFSELQWIESFSSWPPAKLPRLRLPVRPWPMVAYTYENQTIGTALPLLLDTVDPGLALQGSYEKYVRPLQVIEKWAWLLLIVAASALGFIHWINQEVDSKLNARVAMLEKEVEFLEHKVQQYQYDVQGINDVAGAVDLTENLLRALVAPTYVSVWNLFFHSWPEGWKLTGITLSYENRVIVIQAQGTIDKNPDQTARQFLKFRQALAERGFELKDIEMNLMHQEAEFTIMLGYPWPIADRPLSISRTGISN